MHSCMFSPSSDLRQCWRRGGEGRVRRVRTVTGMIYFNFCLLLSPVQPCPAQQPGSSGDWWVKQYNSLISIILRLVISLTAKPSVTVYHQSPSASAFKLCYEAPHNVNDTFSCNFNNLFSEADSPLTGCHSQQSTSTSGVGFSSNSMPAGKRQVYVRVSISRLITIIHNVYYSHIFEGSPSDPQPFQQGQCKYRRDFVIKSFLKFWWFLITFLELY